MVHNQYNSSYRTVELSTLPRAQSTASIYIQGLIGGGGGGGGGGHPPLIHLQHYY